MIPPADSGAWQGAPPAAPSPQIKICGLTRARDAVACARLDIAAVGFVFYPPSPRAVSRELAAAIRSQLPEHIPAVGVFVDRGFDAIMHTVRHCRLSAVQLHGRETPRLAQRLRREGLVVIKALFADRQPDFSHLDRYDVSAFLVECGRGRLPGGNARPWRWEQARDLKRHRPVILAGGLDPANVAAAVGAALPDAVDVSSGVECTPGRKDLRRVRAFVNALNRGGTGNPVRRAAARRIFT